MMTATQIPVIDFSDFVIDQSERRKTEIAQQFYQACHEVGFLYLSHHGIPQALIDEMFAQSHQLFDLPPSEKMKLAWSSEFSNLGYVGIERERSDPDSPGDLKEAFNLGLEADPKEETLSGSQAAFRVNRWPEQQPQLRQVSLEFYKACDLSLHRILRAFALALQLPEQTFVNSHQTSTNTLRLLHYPPLEQVPKPGQIRIGAHSDYGSVTQLFQDQVGGLEVLSRSGEWNLAPCIPGTILLNTGDLMERWTNHTFRSTKHRVGLPKAENAGTHRYSIAYFSEADPDTEIVCLPSCQSPESPPLYPPIKAGEYLLSKLQASY